MEEKRFRQLLKQNGYFVTKARYRLFKLLQRHPALTMNELIRLFSLHDMTTAYRTVELFEKLGIITHLRLGWNNKIELSDIFRHHHHHFSCIQCGRVVRLPDDADLEKQIVALAQKTGLVATDHQLEIRGICKHCQKK